MLVAVDAPYFYAGLIFDGDKCVRAAPILKWAVGKHRNYLSHYFKQKGWKAAIVQR